MAIENSSKNREVVPEASGEEEAAMSPKERAELIREHVNSCNNRRPAIDDCYDFIAAQIKLAVEEAKLVSRKETFSFVASAFHTIYDGEDEAIKVFYLKLMKEAKEALDELRPLSPKGEK